jgi:G6PDH family F420-dependent oxidoreductase
VLGAIAHATKLLRVGTSVTCPTIRYHPAIIAQAAATVAAMMPGRFQLGLGTGENLNEHIVGQRWPPHAVRLAMLEEAIAIIYTSTRLGRIRKASSGSMNGRFCRAFAPRRGTAPARSDI